MLSLLSLCETPWGCQVHAVAHQKSDVLTRSIDLCWESLLDKATRSAVCQRGKSQEFRKTVQCYAQLRPSMLQRFCSTACADSIKKFVSMPSHRRKLLVLEALMCDVQIFSYLGKLQRAHPIRRKTYRTAGLCYRSLRFPHSLAVDCGPCQSRAPEAGTWVENRVPHPILPFLQLYQFQ